MKVLTVNGGSSSLKMRLYAVDPSGVSTLAGGRVGSDRFRGRRDISIRRRSADAFVRCRETPANGAPRPVCDCCPTMPVARSRPSVIVSCRAAPSRSRPSSTMRSSARSKQASGWRLSTTGPRSTGSLRRGRSCRTSRWSPSSTLRSTTRCLSTPSHYALPQGLTLKHGLRRHGYHGIAHRSMMERYSELTEASADSVSLITLQLGNGWATASAALNRTVSGTRGGSMRLSGFSRTSPSARSHS